MKHLHFVLKREVQSAKTAEELNKIFCQTVSFQSGGYLSEPEAQSVLDLLGRRAKALFDKRCQGLDP